MKQNNVILADYLNENQVKDWFINLSDKRHPAAHREPLFMSPVYNQQDMSLISENLVVVNTKKGKGMFDAVKAVKADFNQLLEVTDQILKLLHEKAAKESSS